MKELREIVRAWEEASFDAQLVLVTVVDIQGSTYRRPGARLLIVDGVPHGSISGGCLESELVQTGWTRTEEGPLTMVFDTTSDEDAMFGYGLGCRGIVTVSIRRVSKEDRQMDLLRTHVAGRVSTWMVTNLLSGEVALASSDDLRSANSGRGGLVENERGRFFIENIDPPISLHVYGAGFDAPPLIRIADELGWETHVFDHRESAAVPDRFPRNCRVQSFNLSRFTPTVDGMTAHVVMTHNFEKDLGILGRLTEFNPPYLGVLGPRARTIRLLELIGRNQDLEIVRSPVGLDVGAEAPQEIALAIVSEILAVFRSRSAGFLKDRPQRIHRESIAG